jgi:hypothetical protein
MTFAKLNEWLNQLISSDLWKEIEHIRFEADKQSQEAKIAEKEEDYDVLKELLEKQDFGESGNKP